ncbi:MAG TPA: helix-turn-helix transcriptional regulator [Ktedonobacterales bacterium]|jgi:transcriptional regulator with XRE-family HTH domain|nr:helix-turn-helix transcriptional regulator [Ktedonobacterales bacterium]
MADLQETMGAVIRRERHERGLTLRELAERSALSVVYVGELEHGKKYPSAVVLERLADALDLSVADVLEMVADELRGVPQPVTNAIGFVMPNRSGEVPRITVKRLVNLLEPEEVATMAGLGAFFIARRNGEPQG